MLHFPLTVKGKERERQGGRGVRQMDAILNKCFSSTVTPAVGYRLLFIPSGQTALTTLRFREPGLPFGIFSVPKYSFFRTSSCVCLCTHVVQSLKACQRKSNTAEPNQMRSSFHTPPHHHCDYYANFFLGFHSLLRPGWAGTGAGALGIRLSPCDPELDGNICHKFNIFKWLLSACICQYYYT